MPYYLPPWAIWIQWIATIILALGAATIAYRQWRTARDKLILDLFEKRYSCFLAMTKFINMYQQKPRLSRDEVEGLVFRCGLLFGEDVLAIFYEAAAIMYRADQKEVDSTVKADMNHDLEQLNPRLFRAAGRYMKMHEAYAAKTFDPVKRVAGYKTGKRD